LKTYAENTILCNSHKDNVHDLTIYDLRHRKPGNLPFIIPDKLEIPDREIIPGSVEVQKLVT
jgi:hypothetical protein